jgi:hypothetical protein
VAFVNPAAVFSCIAYLSFQQCEVSLGAHGNLLPHRTLVRCIHAVNHHSHARLKVLSRNLPRHVV